MLLADLGADVIKIERPGFGDDTRSWGPPWRDGEATYYLSTNRNKRSVALDLADERDLARLREMISGCDVVVENFRPGALDRYGLGYAQLERAYPRLVYCSITGFGSGRGARLAGYDIIAQAVGGLMSVTGQPGTEPTKVGVALVDVVTGLHAAIGIQAALWHRNETGHGQLIEVNLLSSLLSALTNQSAAFALTGTVPQAMGNAHPSVAPYQPLRTADRPLTVAATTDRQFRLLATVIGRPELADDDRYGSNACRVNHRLSLVAELESTLQTQPADHWFALLSEHGVPCGPINDISEAFAFAEALGLKPLVYPEPDAHGRVIPVVRNPITLSRTPATYRRSPPELDADTTARW